MLHEGCQFAFHWEYIAVPNSQRRQERFLQHINHWIQVGAPESHQMRQMSEVRVKVLVGGLGIPRRSWSSGRNQGQQNKGQRISWRTWLLGVIKWWTVDKTTRHSDGQELCPKPEAPIFILAGSGSATFRSLLNGYKTRDASSRQDALFCFCSCYWKLI